MALTFDDGPDARSTSAFLELLAHHNVRATFFLLGHMLAASPGIGRDIAAAGHEVAVHGWDHRPAPLIGPFAMYNRLARTTDLIDQTTGAPPRWYRPPYGVLSASAVWATRRLNLTPVLWTNWGRDWRASATPTSVATTVARGLWSGGTILLHDSDCTSAPGAWRASLGALHEIIGLAVARGLTVGPLCEHFDEHRASPRRSWGED